MKTLVNGLKNGALVLPFVILMSLVVVTAGAAVGTFTFRTSGASDTVEAVDLVYPQRVPEADSITTESIADGSITNDKLAEPISIANGGTGATTAAAGLAALGGASLNGSSTVDFAAKNIVSNGNLETGYSGRSSVFSPKIQFRSEMNAAVATYTIATFTTASGSEAWTYLGKAFVRGQTGSEEYTILMGATSNAGNTAITVTTAPTVTASALIGTPADIVASYTTSGANLVLTIYVPQTYHTFNIINQHADTGLVRVNWED